MDGFPKSFSSTVLLKVLKTVDRYLITIVTQFGTADCKIRVCYNSTFDPNAINVSIQILIITGCPMDTVHYLRNTSPLLVVGVALCI